MKRALLSLGIAAATATVVSSAGAYTLIGDVWMLPGQPVPYYYDNSTNESCITGNDERTEIDIAFQTWANVAGTQFSAQNVGTNNTCGLVIDGQNTMTFDDCLGQCTFPCIANTSSIDWGGDPTWGENCTTSPQQLRGKTESDINFSSWARFGTHEDIMNGCQTDNCGASNAHDIRSIGVHEIGHLVGLGHTAVPGATMFASVGACQTWMASLEADDIDGHTCLYDENYIPVDIKDVQGGNVRGGLGNAGNLGVTGSGGPIPGQYGAGFQWPIGTGNVYEAGLILGVQAGPNVSSDARDGVAPPVGGGQDNDFFQSSVVGYQDGATREFVQATYTDNKADGVGYDVSITATLHAFDSAPDDDYVIVCYKVTNNGTSAINGLRVGMYMDWDFQDLFNNQSVVWDVANQVGIISDPSTARRGGIAVVNPEGAQTFRGLQTGDQMFESNRLDYLFDDFTDTDRLGVDINLLIATGDFDLQPDESAYAAFALIGGTNQTDLITNLNAARAMYDQDTICDVNIVGVESASVPGATTINLAQNVPNPFNPATRIAFDLDRSGMVELIVYDARGRAVRTLIQGVRQLGSHTIVWDGRDDGGRDLSSGIYFYTLRANGQTTSRKMSLLK